ncbi:C-type lectin domain family 7 member A isoform 1-T1 [Hipposideros larvatus]
MEYHPDLENLDEDGYTQLDFSSRSVPRRPVISKKGILGVSRWRCIAVTLGILCLVILVIAVVLGITGLWRSNSGSNPLKNDNFPPRNKGNHSQPTQSSLEHSVAPTKALTTTEILSSSCPVNWIMHENSCYLLSTSEDSWERSKAQCSRQGANLLTIESSNELEFIKTQSSFKPNKSFWMGLSRRQTNGPWLWEDGSMFSSYLFQIITTATQENSSHNCVWIHSSVIYDQPCSVSSSSICEKKLSI